MRRLAARKTVRCRRLPRQYAPLAERLARHGTLGRVSVTCAVCGDTFVQLKGSPRKTCGDDCHAELMRGYVERRKAK